MTETPGAPSTPSVSHRGLLARAVGILTAPRSTYGDLIGRPRVLGALLLSVAILATGSLVFLRSEVGRQAVLEQITQQSEARGRGLTDAQYERLESFAPYLGVFLACAQVVGVVLGSLLVALLALAVFNAFLGHNATFKQVWAVVAHSGFVLTLATFLIYPLDYVRESLTSPTTLLVFMPFLEEESFLARFLGAVDLFYVWWLVNLAIGFSVLYKRRTGPIAMGLLGVYVVLALAIAGVRYALSGA